MAFAACNCLNHAIHLLLNSSHPSSSILTSCPQEVQSLQHEVASFQKLLETTPRLLSRCDEDVVGDLDSQAREAAFRLQDAIEYAFVANEKDTPEKVSVVRHEIGFFIEKVKVIKDRYAAHLQQLGNNEEERDDWPRADLETITSNMIGLEDQFINVRDWLMSSGMPAVSYLISLVGMGGVGKSALAKRILQDPSINQHFQICAIVSIGPKYPFKRVIKVVLTQITSSLDIDGINSVETLSEYMKKHLEGKKYLIVLDDVWDNEFLTKFTTTCLPNTLNGSKVLVTTRIRSVAQSSPFISPTFNVRFLNEEEGWNLFLEKVFGTRFCPQELREAGKKIVKNCQGLPLTIIAIAELLSKGEHTPEYWKSIAESANPLSIGVDDQEKITQTLLLSNKYLRQRLKPYFLYMGVFPQDFEISMTRLINLWSAEGFLDSNGVAWDYLEELVSNSVVIISEESEMIPLDYHSFLQGFSERLKPFIFMDQIAGLADRLLSKFRLAYKENLESGKPKTYKLHSAFWHLCVIESMKQKLFHVLNSYDSGLSPCLENQRRLCVHNNVLFAVQEVHESITSISNAHSLLCTGPPHKYLVPACLGLRLLKVFDALTIRFYSFPLEVLKLVLLRYFAITCNDQLPVSISRLHHLQYLIVHQYLNVKSNTTWSYLPVEIWDMKQLIHLQVTGSDLPNPTPGSLLPNLVALLDVSPRSCSQQILGRVPNLQKLEIQIDLAPCAPDSFLLSEHISCLSKLQSLQCVVTNPHNSRPKIATLPPLFKILPNNIHELTLSGLRYPWKCTAAVGELPSLQILKLQSNAFQGYKWISRREHFQVVKILELEDMDLVHWEVQRGCFSLLESLIVKHCYKLECVPTAIITLCSFIRMEFVDAQPSTVASFVNETQVRRDSEPGVHVHSSWTNSTQVTDGFTWDLTDFDLEKYIGK